jgi:uncharacterized C2H2 Zn-finger protein
MDRLPAVREDHNPLALLGFFPGYQRFLIFLRWTSYKCPHCAQVFRRDFWPSNIRLGAGERLCTKCGKVFDDGSREWRELPTAKKLRFFLPPLLLGICGGFLVAAIIVSFMPPRDWRVSVIGLVLFLLLLLVWSPLRMLWVIRSVRRYNNRRSGATT